MGDHELELRAKFGLPEIMGFAARLEARYMATWGARTKRVFDGLEDAGVDAEDLEVKLDESEQLRDVLWRSLDRAVGVSDPEYNSVLGRLVAAACDEAKIDDVAYMTSQIVKLDPLQLRLLLMGFHYRKGESTREVARDEADSYFHVQISAFYQGALSHANPASAKQALDGLVSLGFANRLSTLDYQVTLWAILCHNSIFPGLHHLGALVPDPNTRFENPRTPVGD